MSPLVLPVLCNSFLHQVELQWGHASMDHHCKLRGVAQMLQRLSYIEREQKRRIAYLLGLLKDSVAD